MAGGEQQMVDDLIDLGSLNKWETSFIESLSEKLDRGTPLSEREVEKLEEIYELRMS